MNILLVKLGALGDVLRTTCLVSGLKKKWPGAKLAFLTEEESRLLLDRTKGIDEVLTVSSRPRRPADLQERIGGRHFDVLINLDEDPDATELSNSRTFSRAFGIGRDEIGRLVPLSPEAERLVRLAGDDRFKFRENQLSYPALIYEAVGLRWLGEPYLYVPPHDMADRLSGLFSKIRNPKSEIPNSKTVGLFVGASSRYANKFWNEIEIAAFCRLGAFPSLFLFGGPAERARLERLKSMDECNQLPLIGVDTLDDLVAVISACAVLISGDTLAMHLALAMRVPVAALFGPTSQSEITLFGRGRKIVSPYACGPCYLRHCDIRPSCMSALTPQRVMAAVQEMLEDITQWSSAPSP